jgi:hypothetical protein
MATLNLEETDAMFLQYVGNHLPNGTASHIREDLKPVYILSQTNFHSLYILLRLFYISINAFCNFLKPNLHFTLKIDSFVCDQPMLLAVLLHIKVAGYLALGSNASNLQS